MAKEQDPVLHLDLGMAKDRCWARLHHVCHLTVALCINQNLKGILILS